VVDPDGVDWGWGPIIGLSKRQLSKKEIKATERVRVQIICDVLLYVSLDETKPIGSYDSVTGQMALIPMKLNCIAEVSNYKLHLPPDAKS
jgi:hypothetical protein